MKILLIGATGMLGQALNNDFISENKQVVTVARNQCDYNLDLLNEGKHIIDIIEHENPDVIINSAAIVNLNYCEQNPGDAYTINARLPGLISLACQKTNSYFIQISTDHYYTNDKKKPHTEMDQITLLNEYARTKYAGEIYALNYKNSLVVRTNIVGYRNKPDNLSFIEWIIKSLDSKQPITGYNNYYTSSIDVYSFSAILREIINYKITGILNLASNEVISKYQFIKSFAEILGLQDLVNQGELKKEKEILRADSLGLDINKLNTYLKHHTIPSSEEVIMNLIIKYKEGVFHEL
ncbi:SDR family oxidoreductase [Paucisalibacillus sp. EB02]|uniref:dTDP-4-dehydrorhamnose reductase family protein n=1 Tax=Paucisalibacillus sp. EB02 TaxID=1347087 RepID=UPI0004B81301|nr:SDR family oxidoreductase [Paucisalibacillus sp. EB02]